MSPTERLPWVGPVVVGAIAFLLCIWAPGPVTLTSDEPNWLARADRFRMALDEGDLRLANAQLPMLLMAHQTGPGVTTMWAGTIGHGLVRLGTDLGIVERRPSGPRTDQLVLRAGRAIVSLLSAVALGLLVWAAGRTIGSRAAFVAGALLAVEPFLVGHAGVLHTDALVTLWGALSIVAFASAATGPVWHRPSLVLSGVAAGLAILTKVNALVLVGAGLAVVLLAIWLAGRMRGEPRPSLRHVGFGLASWAVIAAAVFVVLWPAMWVAPLQSIRQSLDSFRQVGVHDRTYFRGVTTDNPGPAYYPVAVLFRATPWLVALALGGLVVVCRSVLTRTGRDRADHVLTAALLVAPLPYLLVISAASQRYDRYALPLFPFMALSAGIAMNALMSLIGPRSGWTARMGFAALAALALLVATQQPYAISYINPALGQKRAEHWILLGWGEGMEQLGAEIDRREQGRCGRVDVRISNQGLDIAVPCGRIDAAGAPKDEQEFEYAIRYIKERQRGTYDHVFRGIQNHGTLVKTVRIDGVTYAQLWKVATR